MTELEVLILINDGVSALAVDVESVLEVVDKLASLVMVLVALNVYQLVRHVFNRRRDWI